MQSSRFPTLLPALLALSIATAAVAQNAPVNRGTVTSVRGPERTDAGTFDGTWYYVNRDGRMALWMRTHEGRPELKIRYQSAQGLETFETDWTTQTSYELTGNPARFSVDLVRADEDVVEGHWFWEVRVGSVARVEEGDFSMYRAGDGRQLVMNFSSFVKRLSNSSRSKGYDGPLVWHFNKASKRLVRWEELPF